MNINILGVLLCSVGLSAHAAVYEPRLQIQFPDQIAQLALTQQHEYPTPELGVSLGYQGAVQATVYIYNAGLASIPSDIHAPVVRQQIAQAGQDIRVMHQRGATRQLQAVDAQPVVVNHVGCGTTFLRQQFSFAIAQEGAPLLSSSVYLTALNNHFVKLRISYPQSDQSARAQSDEFVRQIGRVLAKCDAPPEAI